MLFFVLGALDNYVDFLDNPIVSLGIPLTSLLLCQFSSGASSIRQTLLVCLALSSLWALGYGGLWATKWVIATLATGQDVIAGALSQAATRSGTSGGEVKEAITRTDAVLRNLSAAFPKWSVKVACVALVLLAALAAVKARRGWQLTREAVALVAGCLLAALLPVAWMLAFAQHSYVHFWFVYRDFAVSLIAITVALAGVFTNPARLPSCASEHCENGFRADAHPRKLFRGWRRAGSRNEI